MHLLHDSSLQRLQSANEVHSVNWQESSSVAMGKHGGTRANPQPQSGRVMETAKIQGEKKLEVG